MGYHARRWPVRRLVGWRRHRSLAEQLGVLVVGLSVTDYCVRFPGCDATRLVFLGLCTESLLAADRQSSGREPSLLRLQRIDLDQLFC